MVGKIVIVFDWLKAGWFAEETEVVDWDWFGEECLES